MTLPPDPHNLNSDRAKWAGDAITAFMLTTGTDLENVLSDLLCDLMHWVDRREECFESALQRARWNYAEETDPSQTITLTH